jgi:hypothetical protein
MSEPLEQPDAEPSSKESEPRGGLLYKLALAGVGGVMLAQEEITSFFRRSEPTAVESDEGEVILVDAEEPRDPEECAAERIDTTIDRVLKTLNVPSRSDIDELSRRLETLTTRLEAYKTETLKIQ